MPCACWQSPLGWLRLEERDGLLWSLDIAPTSTGQNDDTPLLREAVLQLSQWFARARKSVDLPLAPRGTAFQQSVWKLLQEVPWGGTVTYGQLAARLGSAHKARAVGRAVGANPWLIVVPCHRVLPAGGGLGGFRAGVDAKRALLSFENVNI